MRDPTEMVSTLHRHLEELGHLYHDVGNSTVRIGARGDHGVFDALVHVRSDPDTLTVIVPIPLAIAEERVKDVAEYVARANFGWRLGGLQFDIGHGSVFYQADLPLTDAELTRGQFTDLIGAGFVMVDTYFRGLCRLLYSDDLSPAEAVAEVEMSGVGE